MTCPLISRFSVVELYVLLEGESMPQMPRVSNNSVELEVVVGDDDGIGDAVGVGEAVGKES
jgi:hypothetical protein